MHSQSKYLASITTVHIIVSDAGGIRFITHSKLSVCVWGGGRGDWWFTVREVEQYMH